jgi:hypothetical protein
LKIKFVTCHYKNITLGMFNALLGVTGIKASINNECKRVPRVTQSIRLR